MAKEKIKYETMGFLEDFNRNASVLNKKEIDDMTEPFTWATLYEIPEGYKGSDVGNDFEDFEIYTDNSQIEKSGEYLVNGVPDDNTRYYDRQGDSIMTGKEVNKFMEESKSENSLIVEWTTNGYKEVYDFETLEFVDCKIIDNGESNYFITKENDLFEALKDGTIIDCIDPSKGLYKEVIEKYGDYSVKEKDIETEEIENNDFER